MDPDPPLPPAHALPEYMGQGGLRFDQRSVDYHYPAVHGGYEGEYEAYGQDKPGYGPEMPLPRTYYAHSQAMAEMGGLQPLGGNMLSPSYEAFGYPDERDLAMGANPPAQAVLAHQGKGSVHDGPARAPDPRSLGLLQSLVASSCLVCMALREPPSQYLPGLDRKTKQ